MRNCHSESLFEEKDNNNKKTLISNLFDFLKNEIKRYVFHLILTASTVHFLFYILVSLLLQNCECILGLEK